MIACVFSHACSLGRRGYDGVEWSLSCGVGSSGRRKISLANPHLLRLTPVRSTVTTCRAQFSPEIARSPRLHRIPAPNIAQLMTDATISGGMIQVPSGS